MILYVFESLAREDCVDGSDESEEVCESCEKTCAGYDCDIFGLYGYSCQVLETYYGCECEGCECALEFTSLEDCVDQGGLYCGDDESNWTSYSPNGCVLSSYICDGKIS